MALSPEELTILSNHVGNNLLVSSQIPNYSQIAIWYDSNPTGDIKNLFQVLTIQERANFFLEQNATKWYSSLCQAIEDQTFTPINTWNSNNSNFTTQHDANIVSLQLVGDLVDNNLTSHTMQELYTAMAKRNLGQAIFDLTICVGLSGTIGEQTTNQLLVEEDILQKRWESLGLSEAPTATEIESVLI